jgi:hypothetical protein
MHRESTSQPTGTAIRKAGLGAGAKGKAVPSARPGDENRAGTPEIVGRRREAPSLPIDCEGVARSTKSRAKTLVLPASPTLSLCLSLSLGRRRRVLQACAPEDRAEHWADTSIPFWA